MFDPEPLGLLIGGLFYMLTDSSTSTQDDLEEERFVLEKDVIMTLAACEAENPAIMADARSRAIVNRTLALQDYPTPVDKAERARVTGYLREFYDLRDLPGYYRRSLGVTVRVWYGLPRDARLTQGDEEAVLAKLKRRSVALSPRQGSNLDALKHAFDVDRLAGVAGALVDAVAELDEKGIMEHAFLFPEKGEVSPPTHVQVKADVVGNLRLRRQEWEDEMASRAEKRGYAFDEAERRAEMREFQTRAAAERARGDDSLKRYRDERRTQ